MAFSKARRQKRTRGSVRSVYTRDRLGSRLRPLRIENLEPRRLLDNGPLAQIATDLSQQLTMYQSTLDGVLSGASSVLTSLPFVGSQLGGISSVQSAIDGAAASIQSKLQAVQNFGGQSDLITALYNALGPGGAHILAGDNGQNDTTSTSAITSSDIHVVTPITYDGTNVNGELEMRLHETIVSANVNLTSGLSTLPIQFQTTGNVTITGSIDLELAIEITNNVPSLPTVHLNDFTSGLGMDPSNNPSQLMFSVTAMLGGASFTAYVGFLQGNVNTVGSQSQNELSAKVYVSSITSPSVTFGGSADLNLNASLSLKGDPNFPSVGTTMTMTWSNMPDPSTLSFSFGNLQLYLGSFLSQELGPVLGDIKQYIQPIADVINVLQRPIPGIDQLQGESSYDLIDALKQFDGSTGYEIQNIATFVDDLETLVSIVPSAPQNGSSNINFGNYSLAGTNLYGPGAVGDAVQNLANGVPGAGALSSLTTGDLDMNSQNAIQGFESDPGSLLTSNGNQSNLANADSTVTSMVDDNSVVSFPVLDDPSSLLGMLFGQDVNLITVNLPLNITNQSFGTGQIFIPIIGPLGIYLSLNANFNASGEIEVGYDSQGLRDALANPSGDIAQDFLDGFYIQGPTGTANTPGYDPGTSLTLNAGINGSAGPEINVDVGSASIGPSGGLTANLNVTMNPGIEESGSGGKIRLSDLGNLDNDFAASGQITANFGLKATVSAFSWSHSWNIVNFVNETLWNYTDATELGNAPGMTQQPPSVYGLSAYAGPVTGGNEITIYGSNLENASVVNFEGNYYGQFWNMAATPFDITPTAIDVDVPALVNGVVYEPTYINVTTPGGQGGGVTVQPYIYDPPPSITSVDPTTAIAAGGTLVAINGSGLLAVTTVSFGGQPGIPYSDVSHPDSDNEIWAYAPSGSGTVSVSVTSPGGPATGGSITYEPQPVVTRIGPSAGAINSSNDGIIAVYGNNFGYYDSNSQTYVGTATNVLFYYGLSQDTYDGDPIYYPVPVQSDTYLPRQQLWEVTAAIPEAGGTGTADVLVETTPTGDPSPIVDPEVQSLGNWSSPTAADQFTYWAPPTILGVTPAAGPVAGGNQVVITGYNLGAVTNSNSTVNFGSAAGTIDSVTQSQINGQLFSMTVTVPPSPNGGADLVPVTVTTPGGPDEVVDAYNYVPPPTFTSLGVGLGGGSGSFGYWVPVAGGIEVTINGTNLNSVTAVDFGGIAGTNLTIIKTVSAGSVYAPGTQLTVYCPAESAGEVGVSLLSPGAPGGSLSTGVSFYYEGTPTVTGVSPTVLNANGDSLVTITGTSLYPATEVDFVDPLTPSLDKQALSIVGLNNSPTQVVVDAPGDPVGTGYYVTVTTPQGPSATGSGSKVSFSNVAPIITAVSYAGIAQTSVPASGGSLIITGSNLYGYGVYGVVFDIAGNEQFPTSVTTYSDSEILVGTGILYPGTHTVTVGGSNSVDFTVSPSAYITSVSPSSGLINPGTLVTIQGVDIQPFEDVVDFGNIAVTALPGYTNSEVQVMSPAPLPASYEGTTVDIKIETNYGYTPLTPADQFTYVAPSLGITSVSPASGPTTGGTAVTITGAYLDDATSVTIGGLAAAIVPGTNTDTTIEVTTPAWTGSTSRPESVVVTGEYGPTPASPSAEFAYYTPAPVVTGVSPASGIASGGTSVTISGTGLAGITAIDFGSGNPANLSTLVYNSNGTVTITSPGGSAGAVDVTVTTAAGGVSAATGADRFTYGNVPSVSLLYYSVGPADDYDALSQQIFGANFTGATEVIYGGTTLTGGQFGVTSNGTQIDLALPSEAAGTVDVQVVTPVDTSAITPDDRFTFTAGPLIEASSNGQGPLTGGTSLTYTGYNFTAPDDPTGTQTEVYVGGGLATITSISSSSITFTTPAGSPGTVGVTIVNPEGSSSVGYVPQFTYFAVPTITGVSPATGPLAGGNYVAVTGTGLEYASIYFGSLPAGGDPYIPDYDVSDTVAYVAAPAGAQYGTVDVTAVSPGGTSAITPADEYTYVSPPAVTSISPASGAWEGGTTVDIAGMNFGGDSSVMVGNADATIVSQSADAIQIVTPPSSEDPTEAQDIEDIVVTASGGASQTSSADQFTYDHAPYISSVAGPIAYNGSSAYGLTTGGDMVTINGDDLENATAVSFGDTPATSFTADPSGTYITAVDPSVAAASPVYIAVTTPLGTTDIQPAELFNYVLPPVISSVTPSNGSTDGGTTVTITGSGLAMATEVDFGNLYGSQLNAATIVSDTDSQIVVTSPTASFGTPGMIDVTVTTPFATSATSSADQFTYVAPPSITSLSTYTGSVYGGQPVTINGAGMTGATEVDFGSNAATILSATDSQIEVLTPEATGDAPGQVYVSVTNAYGQGFAFVPFDYDLPPAVTSISPSSGPAAGGTTVYISGDSIDSASDVEFGGVEAQYISDLGGGLVEAVSPPDTPSTVDITVATPFGTSATTSADQFTYAPPPIVSSVSPPAGPIGGGTTVTISGQGLSGATSVDFIDGNGGNAQGTIQNDSDNTLVVVAPASPYSGNPDIVDITVTTADGTSLTSSADQFSYVVVPSVSGVNPTSGLRTGGDEVTITGTNLALATSVAFGGAAAVFTINPDGSITAISPPGSDGTVDVTVSDDGASSATSAADQFTYLQPQPAVTGVSPSSGAAAGGETVTITGSDLDGATAVYFGSLAAGITGDSPTQIVATVPNGALGTLDVTVTTPGGTSGTSAADQFTGLAAPAVTSLDTLAGPTAGGTDLVIYGTDLAGATAVNFGAVAGTIVNDAGTYILAQSPAHAGGAVDVTVTTPYGTSATSSADLFTFIAPPSVMAAGYSDVSGMTLAVPAASGALANDSDPQGLSLAAVLLTDPANGTLTFDSDGSFAYTPNSGFVGTDSFIYQAGNGYALSAPATVTIAVTPATLTWASGQSGNWTDAKWSGPLPYPNSTVSATVGGSASVVNVTNDESAYGLTVLWGAQVSVGAGAVLTVTTDASVSGGATLSIDPAGLFSTGGTFTVDSGGNVTGGSILASAFQLDNGSVSANLGGSGGVTVSGGTVTMSGVNSYAGATTVLSGTLIVNSAASLPDGSALVIGSASAFAAPVVPAASDSANVATPAGNNAAVSGPVVSAASAAMPAGNDPTAPPSHRQPSPAAHDAVFRLGLANPDLAAAAVEPFWNTLEMAEGQRPGDLNARGPDPLLQIEPR